LHGLRLALRHEFDDQYVAMTETGLDYIREAGHMFHQYLLEKPEVYCEEGDFLLLDKYFQVLAVSGNTEFQDADPMLEMPDKYFIVKVVAVGEGGER